MLLVSLKFETYKKFLILKCLKNLSPLVLKKKPKKQNKNKPKMNTYHLNKKCKCKIDTCSF